MGDALSSPIRRRRLGTIALAALGITAVGLAVSPEHTTRAAAGSAGDSAPQPSDSPSDQAGADDTRPDGLLAPVASINPVTGGHPLSLGWNGTRVRILQKALGVYRTGPRQTFDAGTQAAVISFQRRHFLQPDGVVGPKTWELLAPEYPFDMDAWTTEVALPTSATPEERIDQFIAFQQQQIGAPFTWGGAGWKETSEVGFDCSGLALQALYSAGLDPRPITVVKHGEPTYQSSRVLYSHPGLQSVPREHMQRGDIVFFAHEEGGPVHHVATYIGRGKVIESFSTDVHTTIYCGGARHHDTYYWAKPLVKRPFV